jgi:formiminotetrahydrofolate cyclodeaminase
VIEISSIGDATVGTFLDALAARQSTPGGGGAAALSGSQAAALVSMVINFTLGSKKYADVSQEMKSYLEQSEQLRASLLALADRDAAAFKAVSACYGMPRETEAEQETRSIAIQAALKSAAEVPFVTAQRCLEIIQLVSPVARKGNRNVVSDAATALYLSIAALKSALVNVNVNLKFIKDEEFVSDYSSKRDELLEELDTVSAMAEGACEEVLGINL